MTNLHLELYVLGVVGLFLHYMKSWTEAQKKGNDFSLIKVMPMALLSLVTTALVIYLREDLKEFYPITRVSAVIMGYFGNSVFFSFLNSKKPKIATDEKDI